MAPTVLILVLVVPVPAARPAIIPEPGAAPAVVVVPAPAPVPDAAAEERAAVLAVARYERAQLATVRPAALGALREVA